MRATSELPQGAGDFGDTSELYRHTVPIFDYDRNEPSLEGTGVLISVENQLFVATAAHVLEPGFSKIAFGYSGPQGFRIFGSTDMKILAARAQARGGNPQLAVYKHGLDLAIIQPTEEVLNDLELHYRAFDLKRFSFDPRSEWGVVSGWPARKNNYNSRTRVCDFATCYHIQCPIAGRDDTLRAGWNPDIFIALSANKEKDFIRKSGERIQLPKLHGVSGGGFWVPAEKVDPVDGFGSAWLLSGIAIEDDASKRLLKVVRIRHIWQLLEHGWGLSAG